LAKARAGLHVQASTEAAELRRKVQGIDIAVAEIYAQCGFGIAQGRPRDRLSNDEGLLYDRYLADAAGILHALAKRHELTSEALNNEFELQPIRESSEFALLAREAAAR
jgi:hypothetical protein